MRTRIIGNINLIALVIAFCTSKAQKADTILYLSPFSVVENRVLLPDAYSKTEFDSLDKFFFRGKSMDELLEQRSPVFIKKYSVSGLATPGFRGTGAAHTKLYWNGMPLNSSMNGTFDLSLIPVSFFGDINLNHGGSSLINGSGGIGGSLQMNSNAPENKGWAVYGSQGLGSFSRYNTQAGGKYRDKNLFFKTCLFKRVAENDFPYVNNVKEGFPVERRKNAGIDQMGIMGQAGVFLTPSQTLSAYWWAVDSYRELPGPITSGNRGQRQWDESGQGMLEWQKKGGEVDLIGRSGYRTEKINYEDTSSHISSLSQVNSFFGQGIVKSELQWNIHFTGKYRFDYSIAKTEGYEHQRERKVNSFFSGLSKKIKRMQIDLMARFELIDDRVAPLMPSLGWSFELMPGKLWFWKGNLSRNYQYPGLNDLYWFPGGNPDLLPEESHSAETGILKKFKGPGAKGLQLEMTGYYMKVKNWIAWIPGEDGTWRATNFREVENKGLEFSFKLRGALGKLKYRFNGNLNRTVATNKETLLGEDGSLEKQLIYLPEYTGDFNGFVNFRNYYLNGEFSYTGERFITTDNSMYMPAYYLTNIKLGKEFRIDDLSFNLSFGVNNVFDIQYQSVAWQPMPGINYQLKLIVDLNKEQ